MREWCLLISIALLGLTGCATKRVTNADLWYSVSVPNKWTIGNGGLQSPQGEVLQIQRIRDDGKLGNLIVSTRNTIRRDMVGFVTEVDQRQRIQKRCAWKLVGAHRPNKNSDEYVLIRVIIDTNKPGVKDCEGAHEPGQYKYILTIRTPSESYNQRKKILNKIIKSFSFTIPEY